MAVTPPRSLPPRARRVVASAPCILSALAAATNKAASAFPENGGVRTPDAAGRESSAAALAVGAEEAGSACLCCCSSHAAVSSGTQAGVSARWLSCCGKGRGLLSLPSRGLITSPVTILAVLPLRCTLHIAVRTVK